MGKMTFVDLDEKTRQFMLSEFDTDLENRKFYPSKLFSSIGIDIYPELLREALQFGDVESLADSLSDTLFWDKQGKGNEMRIAQTEFNVFFTRGLCARCLADGGGLVEVYRAKGVEKPRDPNNINVGDQFPCEVVLKDLRNRVNGVSKGGFVKVNSGLTYRLVGMGRSGH